MEYYSQDNAGNTETTHSVEIKIDKTAPSPVSNLHSPTHVPGEYSNVNTIEVEWTASADAISHLDGYAIE
ncbi:MAG: hypothetical protein U9O96_07005 [Candidatus Thermoplasmatota archaeon]|nr:hypothetical protein [Candidatus Thermoplasmatota archaeon]